MTRLPGGAWVGGPGGRKADVPPSVPQEERLAPAAMARGAARKRRARAPNQLRGMADDYPRARGVSNQLRCHVAVARHNPAMAVGRDDEGWNVLAIATRGETGKALALLG